MSDKTPKRNSKTYGSRGSDSRGSDSRRPRTSSSKTYGSRGSDSRGFRISASQSAPKVRTIQVQEDLYKNIQDLKAMFKEMTETQPTDEEVIAVLVAGFIDSIDDDKDSEDEEMDLNPESPLANMSSHHQKPNCGNGCGC